MSTGGVFERKPPYFTEGTWRALSDDVKKRCLNIREHCLPIATSVSGPLAVDGQLFAELKPSQTLNAIATHRSKSEPGIRAFLLPVPRPGPGNRSLYQPVDKASRQERRVEEKNDSQTALKRKSPNFADDPYRGLQEEMKKLRLNTKHYGVTTNSAPLVVAGQLREGLKPSQALNAKATHRGKSEPGIPAFLLPVPLPGPGNGSLDQDFDKTSRQGRRVEEKNDRETTLQRMSLSTAGHPLRRLPEEMKRMRLNTKDYGVPKKSEPRTADEQPILQIMPGQVSEAFTENQSKISIANGAPLLQLPAFAAGNRKPLQTQEPPWRGDGVDVKRPLAVAGQLFEGLNPSQALKAVATYHSKSEPGIQAFLLPVPLPGPGNGSLYQHVDKASRQRRQVEEKNDRETTLQSMSLSIAGQPLRRLPEEMKRMCFNTKDYGGTKKSDPHAADEQPIPEINPGQVSEAFAENKSKIWIANGAPLLQLPAFAAGNRKPLQTEEPSCRGDGFEVKGPLVVAGQLFEELMPSQALNAITTHRSKSEPGIRAFLLSVPRPGPGNGSLDQDVGKASRRGRRVKEKNYRETTLQRMSLNIAGDPIRGLPEETQKMRLNTKDYGVTKMSEPCTADEQPILEITPGHVSEVFTEEQSKISVASGAPVLQLPAFAPVNRNRLQDQQPSCRGDGVDVKPLLLPEAKAELRFCSKPPYFSDRTWHLLSDEMKKRYVRVVEDAHLKENSATGAARGQPAAKLEPAQALQADREMKHKPAPPSAAGGRPVPCRPADNGSPGPAEKQTRPRIERSERVMTTYEDCARKRMHVPEESFHQLAGRMNSGGVNIGKYNHQMANLGSPANAQDIAECDDAESVEVILDTSEESRPSSTDSVVLLSWEAPQSFNPYSTPNADSQEGRRCEERSPTEEKDIIVVLDSEEACDDNWEAPGPSSPASSTSTLSEPRSDSPDQPDDTSSLEAHLDKEPAGGSRISASTASSSRCTSSADRKNVPRPEGASLVMKSMFEFLTLGDSTVKGAQFGVFTSKPLPKGLHFGPHHGVKVDGGEGGGCTWPVRRCGEFFLVDGRPLKCTNWMRDVNYAPSKRRRNLVGFLSGGDIYYRTLREIGAGEELLVGYSLTFAKCLLGKRHRLGTSEPKTIPKACCRSSCPACKEDAYGVPARNVFLACEKCGDLFSSSDYLKKHDRSRHWYHKLRSRHCAYCPYRSNRKNDLLRHVETHRIKRLFVCSICEKGFSRQDNLKVHLRIHSGERPFACGQCGKRFRERIHVVRHENVVHYRRYPLHCPRCGAGAEDVTKLRNHTCKPQDMAGDQGSTARQQSQAGDEATQQQGVKRGLARPRIGEAGGASTVRPRSTTEGAQHQDGVKRRRGRPRKDEAGGASTVRPRSTAEGTQRKDGVKRRRGRPRKDEAGGASTSRPRGTTEGIRQKNGVKRGRGRPRKDATAGAPTMVTPTVVTPEKKDADEETKPIQN